MKPIQFFVLLLIAACVSQIEAGVYTRLIYNNPDCSGFHVAYVYMASTDVSQNLHLLIKNNELSPANM